MFKGIIAIKPLVTMLKMTEAVHHTAVFKATSNGLVCRMKNNNYEEMLDLTLPREAFIQYEHKGTDTFFAFKPAEVLRFFDGIDNGSIELHTDGSTVSIKHETASKTLDFTIKSSIDSTEVDDADIEQIPDFTPVAKLLVRRELLLDAIERIGTERYFKLTIDGNGLGFKQATYSVFYKYGKDVSIKMFTTTVMIEAYHDVLALVPMLKSVPDCNYVMLYSDKDGNLRLEFLLQFKCNANYYIQSVQQLTAKDNH
jgi:hypothetical protein